MHIGTGLISPPSPAEVVSAAADAADRGLAAFWTNQNPGGWDPLTLLASLGRRPAEVGTAIVATYPRHPVTTATEALTLQAAAGGLTLGVGPSHAWYVQDQLGLPYTSPLRHTREYLTVLRPLLHGRPVRFDGEFFTVDTRLEITAPAARPAAVGPRATHARTGPRSRRRSGRGLGHAGHGRPAHRPAHGPRRAHRRPSRHLAEPGPGPGPRRIRRSSSPRSVRCPRIAPHSTAPGSPAPPTPSSSETTPR